MFVTLHRNKFLYNNVEFRAKNKFVKLAHLVGFIINKFCDTKFFHTNRCTFTYNYVLVF
jgi:hypothetical protein